MNNTLALFRRYILRWMLLLIIVLIGAYFRLNGLFAWDEPSFRLHPDERFLTEVASQIRLPDSFERFIDSGRTPLNPRNGNYKFFVYGMLPHEITRTVAVLLTPPDRLPPQATTPNNEGANPEYRLSKAFPQSIRALINPDGKDFTMEIHRIGRSVSAFFDLLSLLMVFLIARRLYGEKVAYLAALMSAGTATLIQQSHFFTVDATSTFFILLTLYYAVRIVQRGGVFDYVGAAIGVGGAIACRITLATVAVAVIVAVIARLQRAYVNEQRRAMLRDVSLAIMWGVLTLFAARTFGPDMFAGTMADSEPRMILGNALGPDVMFLDDFFHGKGYFDIRPDDRFLQSMSDISRFASGEVDWPPTQQWAARPRYIFALSNMVFAGMGAPLGVAAWLGFLVAGYYLLRRRMMEHLIPWTWVLFFFGWQGGLFLMTMRYYLPIYGMLTIFAAWLVVHLASHRLTVFNKLMHWMWQPGDAQLHFPRALAIARGLSYMVVVPMLVVVLGALAWGYAFTRLYTEDHTRVAASRWIYANIPPGSVISSESWDDGLPLGLDGRSADQFPGEAFPVYAEDELSKYFGDGSAENEGLLKQIDNVDYIILSSNRVYDTAGRLVMRYPALINYYKSLFDGSLGFELVAEFRSSPRLLGIEFPTAVWAEEAFSVYDHPRVLIFKKTERYTSENAKALIFRGVVFDEVYKMTTIRASKAMTALHFTDLQWPTYRNAASWNELFSDFTTTTVPWLWWWLALEIMSLAAFILLRRALAGLPDGGFAVAKTLGLLLVAWFIWLAGTINVLPFSRVGVWIVVAIATVAAVIVWVRERTRWHEWWLQRRFLVITTQVVFMVAYLGFVWVRSQNPDLWHPGRGGEKPMDLAFLTAVIRSPTFPPYDPWFAGGMLNYYYFGFVMVGVLVHMTGIVPSTAYNLAVPTIFALTAVGAWGVALAVQGSFRTIHSHAWRWWLRALPYAERRKLVGALLAALFTVVAGNWSQAYWLLPGTGVNPVESCDKGSSYAAQQICGGREEWAFWDATRVVAIKTGDGVINEFPFFTFLFADLHAHMIGLPLLIAALGVMLAMIRQRVHVRALWSRWRERWLAIVLLGLISGVAYATNTWDYPTILGMSVVTLLLVAWRDEQIRPDLPQHIIGVIAGVVVLVVASRVANWPFSQWFASDYTGLERWNGAQTPTAQFIELSGMWLYAALSGVVILLIRLRWLPTAVTLGLAGTLLFTILLGMRRDIPALYIEAIAMGIGAILLMALMWRTGQWALPQWSFGRQRVIQLELPVFEDIERRAPPRVPTIALETIFLTVMVMAVLGISALTEVLVAKGDIGRMNSVFKFGMQVWVFGAISSGVIIAWVWQQLRRLFPSMQRFWQVLTVILVAASFAYPVTATPSRLADRYDTTIPATLNGEAFMSSPNATWSENGQNFDFSEDVAGINWIRQNVTGLPILLEAHAEAYRWDARIATYTGLPTLLGWPWHETQQRSVTDVGNVLNARQNAVRRWYSELDSAKTFEELQAYGVEFVYVGRMERALYGEQTGVAFADLAATGQITEVFRQGETVIYQVPPGAHAPGVLKTGTLAKLPPAPLPQEALLPIANERLAEVTSPGWNPIENQIVLVVLWLLAWYAIALLGLAPAMWLGPTQWVWSRIIGLLLFGYLLWMPVSARIMYNSTTGLLIAMALTILVSVWALARIGLRQLPPAETAVMQWFAWRDVPSAIRRGGLSIVASLRAQWRTVVAFEGIFLASFVVMVLIRMVNPDLWHPAWGGEKPFEFGLLNAVLRSPVMPPYSPFFSGGTINYYYYGYVLLSLPIRLTGVLPEIGYNLVLASLYALVVTGVAAVLWQIAQRRWVALIGALAMGVWGNPAVSLQIGWSRGVQPVLDALRTDGLAGIGAPIGDWFIGSSRVIPNTINEYPAWSFLFGDLHAHVIALPLAIFMLALLWHALTEKRIAGAWWLLTPIVLGAMAITNSWDAPTAVLLLTGVLIRRIWVGDRWWLAVWAVIQAAVIAASAYVGYLPFFQQYVPQIGGITTITTPSPWDAWLAMWGLFVVPTLLVVALVAWRHRIMRAVWLILLLVVALVGLFVPMAGEAVALVVPYIGNPRIWLAVVLIALIPFLLRRQPDHQLWLGVWAIWIAWAIALGVEVVYVRDHMDGGDWYRMNTVFKFGVQSWLLLSVGISLLLPFIWQQLQPPAVDAAPAPVVPVESADSADLADASVVVPSPVLPSSPVWQSYIKPVVLVVLVVPVVLGAAFPLFAVPNRMAYRMDADQAWTLNGLTFMEKASYTAYDRTISFTNDYRAMQWLNDKVDGVPVVMQSSIEFYRDYGVRIAANTGFPTVVSPLHESEQRNGDLVGKRDADVIEFYRTTDPAVKLQILSRYRVGYVVVGPIERAAYGKEGTDAIATVGSLREVFKAGETSIYQVSPNIAQIPPLPSKNGDAQTPAVGFPSAPEPVLEDLSGLESQFSEDPSNIDVMIQLVDGYRRQQRFEEAVAVASQTRDAHPNDVMILHMLGDVAMEGRLFDDAIQAYRDAVSANESPGNVNKLISGMINADRLIDALKVADDAIVKYPDFLDFYMSRGRINALLGEDDAAKQDYQTYLDKAPADAIFRKDAQQAIDQLSQ
ncbi:MAG: hypothetical protein RL076_1092 [Chloroflexota bacterium]